MLCIPANNEILIKFCLNSVNINYEKNNVRLVSYEVDANAQILKKTLAIQLLQIEFLVHKQVGKKETLKF